MTWKYANEFYFSILYRLNISFERSLKLKLRLGILNFIINGHEFDKLKVLVSEFSINHITLFFPYFLGWRPPLRNSNPNVEPIPWHVTGRPISPHPVLRPHSQRILLRQTQKLLRGHHLLLSEWRQTQEAGQCAIRCIFRGDSVLWTGRVCHYKIQVSLVCKIWSISTNNLRNFGEIYVF